MTIALLQHFSNSDQHCGQVLSTAPQFVTGFCLSVIEYTVCRFLSTFQDQLTVCNKHYYFSFDNPACFSLRIVYCTFADFYKPHTRGSTLFDCNSTRIVTIWNLFVSACNLQAAVHSLQANTNSAIALLWCVWMQPWPRNACLAGASNPRRLKLNT